MASLTVSGRKRCLGRVLGAGSACLPTPAQVGSPAGKEGWSVPGWTPCLARGRRPSGDRRELHSSWRGSGRGSFRRTCVFPGFILGGSPSPLWGYSGHSIGGRGQARALGLTSSLASDHRGSGGRLGPPLGAPECMSGRRPGHAGPWPPRALPLGADARPWERRRGISATFTADSPLGRPPAGRLAAARAARFVKCHWFNINSGGFIACLPFSDGILIQSRPIQSDVLVESCACPQWTEVTGPGQRGAAAALRVNTRPPRRWSGCTPTAQQFQVGDAAPWGLWLGGGALGFKLGSCQPPSALDLSARHIWCFRPKLIVHSNVSKWFENVIFFFPKKKKKAVE